jgi:hypothetical protein
MRLDIGLEALEPVCQILYISPSPVSFCTLDLLSDEGVISEICIVEVSVVAQEEGREVQG